MKNRVSITVAVCCIAVLAASGAAWLAHGQTTNASDGEAGFQRPLVRDIQLVNEVRALTARVEQLEIKVKSLEGRAGKVR